MMHGYAPAMTAAESPRERPAIYVVAGRERSSRSIFERLAALYRLYPYGESGLSTVVRAEIERGAMTLTIVFLFDLCAWTLIWNTVFHRGELVADGLTLSALASAGLFPVIVLSFDQGVITMDWRTRGVSAWMKRWVTIAPRLRVGAACALATPAAAVTLAFSPDLGERGEQE